MQNIFGGEGMKDADRTRSEFELWVEEGIKLFASIDVMRNIYQLYDEFHIKIEKKKRVEVLTRAMQHCYQPAYYELMNIVIDSLEVIYKNNPIIHPTEAIPKAIHSKKLSEYFTESELLLACFVILSKNDQLTKYHSPDN